MPQDFTEKTLEQIIFENKSTISERGFPSFYANVVRQFKLPSGKVIDILSFMIAKDILLIKVFELKRDTITVDALCQVSDYASELFRYTFPHFTHVFMEKYVVGSDVAPNVESLHNSQMQIELYRYKYTINGIYFKQHQSFVSCEEPEIFELLSQESPHTIALADRLRSINNANLSEKQN